MPLVHTGFHAGHIVNIAYIVGRPPIIGAVVLSENQTILLLNLHQIIEQRARLQRGIRIHRCPTNSYDGNKHAE